MPKKVKGQKKGNRAAREDANRETRKVKGREIMDFDLTEEQKMMRDNARTYLLKEIAPQVNEFENRGRHFTHDEACEFTKKLMPLGYVISALPEEAGGLGLSFTDQGVLQEELWRVWGSLGGFIFTNSYGLVMEATSDHIRERYEGAFHKGELIIAGGFTEPNHGSDLAGLETTAVPDGKDLVINGNKIWCSNGSIADAILTLAVDKSTDPPGTSLIFVPKEAGYTTRDIPHIGLKCLNTAEVWYSDVRVPLKNVIEPELAYKNIVVRFEFGRALIATEAVGLAQAAIDASITYAQQRVQFGRPIGGFQMIQNMIADMVAETEASRFLAYRALHLIDKGERCRWQSSLAKFYATERAISTASKAIEIHGAMGYSSDYPVERIFRDARMLTHPDGAANIQRLVVGRELIGINAIRG